MAPGRKGHPTASEIVEGIGAGAFPTSLVPDPTLASDDPAAPSPSPLHPVHDALSVADERDLDDLRDIISRVRWVKSSGLTPERFQVVKAAAVFDLYTDWNNHRKTEELFARFPDTKIPKRGPIARIRKTKAYADICRRLEAAHERIRTPNSLDEQVEEGAVDAFETLRRQVIRGRGKEAYMAAREFTDRALPKLATDQGGRSVVIGLAIGQQLFDALGTLQKKGATLDATPELKQLPE